MRNARAAKTGRSISGTPRCLPAILPTLAWLAWLWTGGIAAAPAATLLYLPMDRLDGWSVRTLGPAEATLAARGQDGRCVQLAARQATALLSRQLPLDGVRGRRLQIGCLARSQGVEPGVQLSSTAKIHLAVRTPLGIAHHSARLAGADQWQYQGFSVDVPESAEQVILNLGLEACTGTVQFGQLIVRNDRRGVHCLDLAAAANAHHGQLGLAAFPSGRIVFKEIPFEILDASKNGGADCIRLKGVDHEDWPERISPPIDVGHGARTIHILHATLTEREASETPCAMWSAWFSGGHSIGLSVFEGREIGSVSAANDLENWRIAWREQQGPGPAVAFGVTQWPIPIESPIVKLTARAYRGLSPVILAMTVVEEPPLPPPEIDDEEVGGGQ